MHSNPTGPARPGPAAAHADGPDAQVAAPTAEDLTAAVRRLSRTSVMVIGDVMLDRTVYGTVERISPEAPVPVLSVEREVAVPGGAGNVVRNLTALGAAVAFVSVVGDDQDGSDLTGLIGGQPGVEPWLLVQGGRATTVKTRFVSGGQQLLRSDREEIRPIPDKLAERMMRVAGDTLAATSVAVLSDYGKGVLSGGTPALLIAAAKATGRQVVVDPKGADYARYAGADVVTPNRRQLAEASGQPAGTDAEIADAALALRTAHGFGAVLVTRGEDGMTLADAAGVLHLPAAAADVYDPTGAGDAVVAALAAGLAAGLDLRTAARLANLAAGVVVGKPGIAVAREEDLIHALSPQGGALRKIVSRETAIEQVERWRRNGWRDRLRQRLLRPDAPRPCPPAGTGAQPMRPAAGRPAIGCQRRPWTRRRRAPRAARTRRAPPCWPGCRAVDLVCLYDEDTSMLACWRRCGRTCSSPAPAGAAACRGGRCRAGRGPGAAGCGWRTCWPAMRLQSWPCRTRCCRDRGCRDRAGGTA